MGKRFFLVWLGIISFQLQAQTIDSQIREAIAMYDYETAINLIDEEAEPEVPLLFLKARALRGLNRYGEALHVFQSILDEYPDNQQALIEQAECYKSVGKQKEAWANYKQVIEINPENKYAWIQLITLLSQMERYRTALEYSQQLLEKDSTNVTLRLLAQCHEGLGDTESAQHCYEKIIERDPHDYLSVARLANIYIQQEDTDRAIECTEEYSLRDTLNIHVNRQNALAYCLSKEYETAAIRYQKLLSQEDSTFHTCYYAGVSFYVEQKFYDAHDVLEKALDYQQGNVNVLYYLGKSCAKTSWKEDGIKYMQQAIELSIPKDATMIRLYHGLADCYNMARKFPEYIDALKQQYAYDPDNHRLLYHIGTAYQMYLKDIPNATRYLERFLKTKDLPNRSYESQPDPEEGVTMTIENFYNAAERRLKDLKKEQFFKEGIPEKSSE